MKTFTIISRFFIDFISVNVFKSNYRNNIFNTLNLLESIKEPTKLHLFIFNFYQF